MGVAVLSTADSKGNHSYSTCPSGLAFIVQSAPFAIKFTGQAMTMILWHYGHVMKTRVHSHDGAYDWLMVSCNLHTSVALLRNNAMLVLGWRRQLGRNRCVCCRADAELCCGSGYGSSVQAALHCFPVGVTHYIAIYAGHCLIN